MNDEEHERCEKSAWQTVVDNPSSISARAALRDEWIRSGNPRGKLLQLALRLHAGIVPSTEHFRALDELNALLEEHRRDWAGPIAERTDEYEYQLGMPARLGMTANEVILRAGELVELAPIVHVGVGGPGDVVVAVQSPALAKVRSVGVGWGATPDDAVVQAIAANPHLANVRQLYLRNGTITARGLRALAASPYLKQLVYADLTGNPCETEVSKFESGRYYVGPAGGELLQEAMNQQAMSYGSGLEWPPTDNQIIWTD